MKTKYDIGQTVYTTNGTQVVINEIHIKPTNDGKSIRIVYSVDGNRYKAAEELLFSDFNEYIEYHKSNFEGNKK